MQTLTDLIEQEREKHEERIRRQEERQQQEEDAAREEKARKQAEYLIDPWLEAAKAAGMPSEIASLATIGAPDHVDPHALYIERRRRYPGGNTYYTDRTWRRLDLLLPRCADIEIRPAGGKNYGFHLEAPISWHLIVKIPTGIGEAYDWDDETEEIHFVERADSEPYQIENWRDAIGHAAAEGEAAARLEREAEERSEKAREEYRRQRARSEEPNPNIPRIIASNFAEPADIEISEGSTITFTKIGAGHLHAEQCWDKLRIHASGGNIRVDPGTDGANSVWISVE